MSLARSYAQALLETAQEKKLPAAELDQLERELECAAGLLVSSRDLRLALTGPTTTSKEKADLLAALASKAGYSKLVSNFLHLLARKERVGQLGAIHEAFGAARLEAEGGVMGRVVSAESLAAADLDELCQSFTKKLGRKVSFRASTDPELLAGLKVTVNGVTYDGSLRSQLNRLRDRFVAGASI